MASTYCVLRAESSSVRLDPVELNSSSMGAAHIYTKNNKQGQSCDDRPKSRLSSAINSQKQIAAPRHRTGLIKTKQVRNH